MLSQSKVVDVINNEINVLGNKSLSLPNEFKLKQTKNITITNIKFNLTDNLNNPFYTCEVKTFKDKFNICDNDGKKVAKFELIPKSGRNNDYELVINTNDLEKKFLIKQEYSVYKHKLEIEFVNEKTQEKEIINTLSFDRSCEIYYGRKREEGSLICYAVRNKADKQEYDVSISNNVDKTFITILLIAVIRFTQVHSKEII